MAHARDPNLRKILLTMLLTTSVLGASPAWAKDCLELIRVKDAKTAWIRYDDDYRDNDYVLRNRCDQGIKAHYCFEEVADYEDEYGDINPGFNKCPDIDSASLSANDETWAGEAEYPGPLHWVECVDRDESSTKWDTDDISTGIETYVDTILKSRWTGSKLMLEKCDSESGTRKAKRIILHAE